MKEIGRFGVTREMLDDVFSEGHNGISIATKVGSKIQIRGFALYEVEDGGKSLKLFDTEGRDYYTQSQVFIRNTIEYFQTKEDEEFPIEITVVEVTSKKGRKYLTIEEAVSGDGNNDGWRSVTW